MRKVIAILVLSHLLGSRLTAAALNLESVILFRLINFFPTYQYIHLKLIIATDMQMC